MKKLPDDGSAVAVAVVTVDKVTGVILPGGSVVVTAVSLSRESELWDSVVRVFVETDVVVSLTVVVSSGT